MPRRSFMARKSFPYSLLLGSLALGAAIFAAIVGIGLMSQRDAEAGIENPFALYFDCSPSLGVQTNCIYAPGTTTFNVDAIFQNNSGATTRIGTFNFDAITNQNFFNPAAGVSPPFDGNPDFDQ